MGARPWINVLARTTSGNDDAWVDVGPRHTATETAYLRDVPVY